MAGNVTPLAPVRAGTDTAMLVVGLTGNIGSGKSTVARLLEARGVPVIDADVLAREAVAPGTPALAAIVARFGENVIAPDGTLDRAALRHIIFADPAERAALDAIVHPAVNARRRTLLNQQRALGARVVVCDIPLLFEAGLDGTMDAIVLVDAPRDIRLTRIMHDRGLTRAEALAMIDSQLPAEGKRARSAYVIDNDGTLDDLRSRFEATWHSLEHDRLS
jgi:dephospho-CoA kinase